MRALDVLSKCTTLVSALQYMTNPTGIASIVPVLGYSRCRYRMISFTGKNNTVYKPHNSFCLQLNILHYIGDDSSIVCLLALKHLLLTAGICNLFCRRANFAVVRFPQANESF